MHIIIDADPLVYRSGFASEKASYEFVLEDPHGGLVQDHVDGDPRPQKKVWAEQGYTVLAQERLVTPDPVEYAITALNTSIKAMIYAIEQEYRQKASKITLLLSGPGNFRNEIATIRPYKGNRDKAHRPVHYQALRDYLVDRWHAQVIEKREADDEASIIAHGHTDWSEYVVATNDKDLDQIPGRHYDYGRKVHYEVDEFEGLMFFYQQCLSGDATDHIPGCKGVDSKAADMVGEWVSEAIEKDYVVDTFVWDRIVDTYLERGWDGAPEERTREQAEAVAIETARLVKMQEYPSQLWTPPGQEDEVLEVSLDD